MIGFLLRVLLLFSLLLSWGLGLNRAMVLWSVNDTMNQFDLPTTKRIILGDSHAQRIALPGALNFSKASDPFFMSFAAYRMMSRSLSEPHEVILSVGPHNFSQALYDSLLHETNWKAANAGRIAYLLDDSDWSVIDIPEIVLGSLVLNPRILGHQEAIASLPRMTTTDLSDSTTRAAIKRHQVNEENWFSTESESRASLSDFANHLAGKNVQLVLVGTPLHRDYRDNIEPVGFQEYRAHLNDLNNLEHVRYLSLEQVEIPDDYFGDADHLNLLGARWLTDTLSSVLSRPNDSQFVQ